MYFLRGANIQSQTRGCQVFKGLLFGNIKTNGF